MDGAGAWSEEALNATPDTKIGTTGTPVDAQPLGGAADGSPVSGSRRTSFLGPAGSPLLLIPPSTDELRAGQQGAHAAAARPAAASAAAAPQRRRRRRAAAAQQPAQRPEPQAAGAPPPPPPPADRRAGRAVREPLPFSRGASLHCVVSPRALRCEAEHRPAFPAAAAPSGSTAAPPAVAAAAAAVAGDWQRTNSGGSFRAPAKSRPTGFFGAKAVGGSFSAQPRAGAAAAAAAACGGVTVGTPHMAAAEPQLCAERGAGRAVRCGAPAGRKPFAPFVLSLD